MHPELTLLHTSPGHVARFEGVRSGLAPEVSVRHVVNEGLLAAAVLAGGLTARVRRLVEAEVVALAGLSRVLLCTCSTLGEVAEGFDGTAGARVLRVDRPLAARAVTLGRRIAVVACLESTLEPTRRLIEEEASSAGCPVELSLSLVPGAWERFLAGQQEEYLAMVGARAAELAPDFDVVVLAQASMHGAERFARTATPVLSSPVIGFGYALDLLGR